MGKLKLLSRNLHDRRYQAVAILALCIIFHVASNPAYPLSESRDQVQVTSVATRVSLAGPWKMRNKDVQAYAAPDYDDSTWTAVDLPGNLMPTIDRSGGGNAGILWLRKTVFIDSAVPREDIGLILGRIAHADEVFFNGEKIGGLGDFPPAEHSMWNHPRHYQVPRSVIRFGGANVIAVRLSYNLSGEVQGTLGLTNMTEWEQSRVLSNFFLIILPYLFIAAGIPCFLAFLYFMVKGHNSRDSLFYCLQLCCMFLIILDGCNYWDMYGSLLTRYLVLGLAWGGITVLHQKFLHRLYHLKREKVERYFGFYFFMASAALALFFINENNLRTIGILFIAATLSLGLYNLTINLVMLVKKRRCPLYFTLFDIIFLIGCIHDGLLSFMRFARIDYGWIIPGYMIAHFGSLPLLFAITMSLVSSYYRVMGEMRILASSVKSFVAQNTMLKERLEQSCDARRSTAPAAIIDRADERIEQVLRYIRENFTEDISREGLAAMVDIHPDTLGRFFKIYANMRIGDYINELRINAATRKLLESDATIITIAFEAGFDSLRTFNRVFRKIMKMTPEEYRKNSKPRNQAPVTFSTKTAIEES